MALNINVSNFEELLKDEKVLVVDFWATWCGPCKQIAPIVEELAGEYAEKVNIGKCDIDTDSDLPARFSIRNIPTLLFFKNGELRDKLVGASSKATIKEKIDQLL